jgi:hypothetical protein
MSNLSYTQEFFLCAFDSSGKSAAPALSLDYFAPCLAASGLLELLEQGSIVQTDANTLVVEKPLDGALSYLKPLYDELESLKKHKKADQILEKFITGDQLPRELLTSVGDSLVAAGCADKLAKQGLFKNKTRYAPKPDATKRVIEKIRAEFLGDGTVSKETLILTVLLDKCDILKSYFSKVEAPTLKARVKELRESDAYAPVKKALDYMEGLTGALVILATVH